MRVDEGEAKHHSINLRQNVSNRPKIIEGFAHLLAVNVDETVVQPVMNNGGMAGVALALENFSLVMGETEVVAPSMNVKFLFKMVERHRRTFNVPSRSAWPPR